MNSKTTSLFVCLTIFLPISVFSQTDFFWSFHDLNDGATNSDAVGNFAIGDTGSLFMYYSTNGPADSDLSVGAFLDIATSQSGVIRFTDAETFDFAIHDTNTNLPIDNRWLDEKGGGGSAGHTGTVLDDFIDEWNAFTVTGGTGILEHNNGQGMFLDLGYDAGADGFLFGRIDFEVIGRGSVDIFAELGDGGIGFCGAEACEYWFGGAVVNVVPEPGVGGTILIALLTITMNCRRRQCG